MILHTARLTLRPMVQGDADLIFAIMSDPHAMRFWDRPALTRPAVADDIVAEQIAAMGSGGYLYWTAWLGGTPIGSCDLSAIDGARAQIGFLFRREYWGQGYAREAVAAMIAHAQADLELRLLTARIHAGNARAARLLRHLGFRHNTTLNGFELPGGGRCDCEIYLLQGAG
jgi:RimJ/RimL family protein N-acetyltransferase